jgi:hypothetical protein
MTNTNENLKMPPLPSNPSSIRQKPNTRHKPSILDRFSNDDSVKLQKMHIRYTNILLGFKIDPMSMHDEERNFYFVVGKSFPHIINQQIDKNSNDYIKTITPMRVFIRKFHASLNAKYEELFDIKIQDTIINPIKDLQSWKDLKVKLEQFIKDINNYEYFQLFLLAQVLLFLMRTSRRALLLYKLAENENKKKSVVDGLDYVYYYINNYIISLISMDVNSFTNKDFKKEKYIVEKNVKDITETSRQIKELFDTYLIGFNGLKWGNQFQKNLSNILGKQIYPIEEIQKHMNIFENILHYQCEDDINTRLKEIVSYFNNNNTSSKCSKHRSLYIHKFDNEENIEKTNGVVKQFRLLYNFVDTILYFFDESFNDVYLYEVQSPNKRVTDKFTKSSNIYKILNEILDKLKLGLTSVNSNVSLGGGKTIITAKDKHNIEIGKNVYGPFASVIYRNSSSFNYDKIVRQLTSQKKKLVMYCINEGVALNKKSLSIFSNNGLLSTLIGILTQMNDVKIKLVKAISINGVLTNNDKNTLIYEDKITEKLLNPVNMDNAEIFTRWRDEFISKEPYDLHLLCFDIITKDDIKSSLGIVDIPEQKDPFDFLMMRFPTIPFDTTFETFFETINNLPLEIENTFNSQSAKKMLETLKKQSLYTFMQNEYICKALKIVLTNIFKYCLISCYRLMKGLNKGIYILKALDQAKYPILYEFYNEIAKIPDSKRGKVPIFKNISTTKNRFSIDILSDFFKIQVNIDTELLLEIIEYKMEIDNITFDTTIKSMSDLRVLRNDNKDMRTKLLSYTLHKLKSNTISLSYTFNLPVKLGFSHDNFTNIVETQTELYISKEIYNNLITKGYFIPYNNQNNIYKIINECKKVFYTDKAYNEVLRMLKNKVQIDKNSETHHSNTINSNILNNIKFYDEHVKNSTKYETNIVSKIQELFDDDFEHNVFAFIRANDDKDIIETDLIEDINRIHN